jgi:hypothetical protein
LRVGQDSRERRLFAADEAGWERVSERDVYNIAAIFIREHGVQAARRAGEWGDLMLDRGDRGGHAVWRQILWAIEAVRHESLRQAERRASGDRSGGHVPRLYPGIDGTLEQVIREALAAAGETGQDDLAQTERAVQAARDARPSLSLPDALSAVAMARRQ